MTTARMSFILRKSSGLPCQSWHDWSGAAPPLKPRRHAGNLLKKWYFCAPMAEETQEISQDVPQAHYSEKEREEIFHGEFMPHINSMYNFGYRLTLDADDAKDLVQD